MNNDDKSKLLTYYMELFDECRRFKISLINGFHKESNTLGLTFSVFIKKGSQSVMKALTYLTSVRSGSSESCKVRITSLVDCSRGHEAGITVMRTSPKADCEHVSDS